ncbi:nucleotide exchange factor GrpE [Paenactinomyces guangxiensis]|uniref:Nucleotide exchange factor GrpE n=1 Tax=Paenactinomyces guangxiensis TaxID=1490290 RepID=A0A7W1WTN1_9BACL|nr:nucleotide exchange factor GrpE [Paenactinomyces guangxiensis]MBA4495793.1 nucleotide exchange factor GrpE [Paenactinomyces guangxiensis]MBH8592883.1 nucleotide exchange factor GrpE [Paenactinomyces guangxiensis]
MSPRKENQKHMDQVNQPSLPEPRYSFLSRERGAIREMKEAKPLDRQHQQVLSMLSGLQQNFSSLLQVVTNRLSYDKTKEAAFDKLYKEMEELKQDQELNQLRPLYIDLILHFDRMESIYRHGSVSPELTEILKTLSGELIEILYRRGVEPLYTQSDYFDPKTQQAVKVEPTSNPAEDNKIVGIVRHGFKYKEVILRPIEVVVKKYQP